MASFLSIVGNLVTEITALVTSSGAGDAGKIIQTNGAGKIDETLLPSGIGPEVRTMPASEALAAGDMINVFNDSGTAKARKADASVASGGKRAMGFVKAAVSSGTTATVYYGNINDQLSGLTIGQVLFLSGGTAGTVTATAPITSGHITQEIGIALSATEALIEIQKPIVRA